MPVTYPVSFLMICTAACRSFVWPLRIRNGSYLGHVYGLTWAWIRARERAGAWLEQDGRSTQLTIHLKPSEERVEPIAAWRVDWLAEWLAACAPTAPLIYKSMPIKIEIVELVDDVLEPTKAAEPQAG